MAANKEALGAFFTPLQWGMKIIRRWGIHQRWAAGASVLDPTAGDGALLEALIRVALEEGIPLTEKMLGRLKGYEQQKAFCESFVRRMDRLYQLQLPGTIEEGDFLTLPQENFDILLGNPPWINYTDLPEEEKAKYRPLFLYYGLGREKQQLLWGGSRIDLAALVIQKAMEEHLQPQGEAFFFIPLSLLRGEGAHNQFRQGKLREGGFAFWEALDFGKAPVFPGVTTRCGVIHLQKGREQKQPIPYSILNSQGVWESHWARPVSSPGSAYCLTDSLLDLPKVSIPPNARPRQGINTGGRNALFLFQNYRDQGNGLSLVENGSHKVLLEKDLLYPLIQKEQFRGENIPGVYVFLPYNSENGKPLSPREIEGYPHAQSYLQKNRRNLEDRRGALLRKAIAKGCYWALLGVGPYTFKPWKVVWEAYGRKVFSPQVFGPSQEGKPWIPNQALQASCSFDSEEETKRVCQALSHPRINTILTLQNIGGSCNWAQPGRIKHFLEYS